MGSSEARWEERERRSSLREFSECTISDMPGERTHNTMYRHVVMRMAACVAATVRGEKARARRERVDRREQSRIRERTLVGNK